MLSTCAYTHPHTGGTWLWRVFDCGLNTGTFASDATAVKGAAPSLAVPPVFQQLGTKSQELCWKGSNLTARNDGEGERNRRFGKDLGREKD